jgi:hypothetical protein
LSSTIAGIPISVVVLRLHYSENRKNGQFVHVVMPGVVTAIAAWMLDAACCDGMGLGDAWGPHCRRLRIWMTSYSTAECGEPVAANRISSRNTKMPDPQFRLQRYQRQLLISFEPPPSPSSCKRAPPVGVQSCDASHRSCNRHEGGGGTE